MKLNEMNIKLKMHVQRMKWKKIIDMNRQQNWRIGSKNDKYFIEKKYYIDWTGSGVWWNWMKWNEYNKIMYMQRMKWNDNWYEQGTILETQEQEW